MAHEKSREGARPFSIRLTETEIERLRWRAQGKPIGLYIRDFLLGSSGRTKTRRPDRDAQAFARLLAVLGQSGLADNLARIAKLAEAGTLYCDAALHLQLREACGDVRAMRGLLMQALGKELPCPDVKSAFNRAGGAS